jgi:hypothetical protein
VYAELTSRDDWRRLTMAERGLLLTIWLEFAAGNGRVTLADLCKRCGTRVDSSYVRSLNHAGFIGLSASKPLALRALAREEKRREEKKAPVAHATKAKNEDRRENAGAYKPHQPDPVVDPVDPEVALELVRQLANRYANKAP